MKRKKILFIQPSLKTGGAERVISFLASNIDKEVFTVKLIVVGFEKDVVYDVSNVNVKYLNKKRLLVAIPKLLLGIWKEKPFIVFSSIGHVNIVMGLFSLLFPKIKFIAREASVFSYLNPLSGLNGKLYKWLMNFSYSHLDRIVCQSQDMSKDLLEHFSIGASKLKVINNPISMMEFHPQRELDNRCVKFITVGRLSVEKGHKRVLDALSKVISYNFHYTIVGSGILEEEIRLYADNLRLTQKITWIPYTRDVLKVVSKHDYFLQGSYVEGFPNSLLESCTVGTPVIAYNAPGGTKEIIEENVNGYLCDTEKEFISVLEKLSNSEKFNRQIVIKSVINKFDSDVIINKYESLFSS